MPVDKVGTLAGDIGPAECWHIGWIATLHSAELRAGLFPELGAIFMERYHRTTFESPHSTCLVACIDGAPVGFAVGFANPGAHLGWVLRHRWQSLTLAAAGALLRRPSLLARFVRTRVVRYSSAALRHSLRRTRPAQATPALHGTLMHIAVAQSARGQGVGAALSQAMADELATQGARSVHTRTSTADRFYRCQGWLEIGYGIDVDGQEYRCFATAGTPARSAA